MRTMPAVWASTARDSSLISTSARMALAANFRGKAAGTRPPENRSQGFRHDWSDNTGNRSQLPVTPWFASRRRWRSARSLLFSSDSERLPVHNSVGIRRLPVAQAPLLSLARNRRIIVPPVEHRPQLEVRAESQGPSQGNREEEDFSATDETRMEHG